MPDLKPIEGTGADSTQSREALDKLLLAAHAAHDRFALVSLYTRAADVAVTTDAACFYLTHAYIYALDLGDSRAPALRARLVAQGRET